ncbi:MAG: GAF domain-containing protein [candidate division Zixibacteria bacterium]|nr:GAF domain-containing protein [candidate division Zixibacteria bacterium]
MERRRKLRPTSQAQGSSMEEEVSELTDANKRLKRKIFDLYTIFEISVHLNSMLTSDQLLEGILLTSIGQMGVGGASIMLAKPEFQQLQKTTKMPKDFCLELCCTKGLSYKGENFHFEPNRRLYHLMLSQKRPLTVVEVSQTLETRQSELEKLRNLETELLVPMILKNQIRGIMTLTKKISKAPFHENDLEFLSILANQLTVAIENARLYRSEKEAHSRLANTQQKLLESEKMAALGKLSASIAHEINNPLGIIKNYLLMMKLDLDGNEKALNNISVIHDEVNRISSIVNQLLDFYRPYKNVFELVDIRELLNDIINVMSNSFEEAGVNVQLDNGIDRSHKITGSSEQLRQVFMNILINATEAMPDGGDIRITSILDNDCLRLSVSDKGTGIPDEYINRIFEPFFTTKEGNDGTGLGLSVSYGIVKNHGGSITVKNNEDRGATFTISLPLKEPGEET